MLEKNKPLVLLFSLILLGTVNMSAQEKKTLLADGLYYQPQPAEEVHGISHVSYVKDHLYYHIGDELNVIDIDVEWPDKVDGSLVKPLQRWLAENLMKVEADNLPEAYEKMKARYGEPVKEKFKTLPDDRKYCHVSCELKEMGYEPAKYISYILTYMSAPKSLSSQKADTTVMLVSYDLAGQKVLTIDDIIRRERLTNPMYSRDFTRMIVNGSGEYVEGRFNAMQVIDGCISGEDILFKTLWTGDEDSTMVVSAVPWQWLKDYLKKDLYKQLRRPGTPTSDESYTPAQTKDGQPIYVVADQNAEFPGGADAMMKHITSSLVIPDEARTYKKAVRCLASFVVSDKGTIDDVAVISKVNPDIDRAVVSAIKTMPLWKPAQVGGKNVNQRLSIPIQFLPEK